MQAIPLTFASASAKFLEHLKIGRGEHQIFVSPLADNPTILVSLPPANQLINTFASPVNSNSEIFVSLLI